MSVCRLVAVFVSIVKLTISIILTKRLISNPFHLMSASAQISLYGGQEERLHVKMSKRQMLQLALPYPLNYLEGKQGGFHLFLCYMSSPSHQVTKPYIKPLTHIIATVGVYLCPDELPYHSLDSWSPLYLHDKLLPDRQPIRISITGP
jgi:hypothetical protein